VNALRRPGVAVWALLMAATAASWALGSHHATLAGGARLATALVLVLAFAKVQLIGSHFMELRRAPRALSALFSAWVVVVCAVLVGMYLAGPAA
jgi:hypothetical protein